MPAKDFIPTDAFAHRYANEEILRSTLEKPPLSFKPRQIIVKATRDRGFEVQLPRKLTDEERELVLKAFEEYEEQRRMAELEGS